MIEIYAISKHPDLEYRDIEGTGELTLRLGITEEILSLEKARKEATSSAELHWIQQKKLELFTRIFGF